MTNCIFCQKEVLMNKLPDSTPCKRDTYDDELCFAILAPEQYTTGHTLLILKEHKTDITDDISPESLSGFINAIHKVSRHLKELAQNERQESPDRIYVAILCDGIQHLHAHIIPRYPFNEKDKDIYKATFSPRDGEEAVRTALLKGDMGGYWYIAEREAKYKGSQFGLQASTDKARILETLANKLRLT